ncbi:MAG: T9SS type A sorting domain-containing protein [Flavobacteriales bacterium]|nr:T9SS type A sorting domain-containing protein [Flavobacteriales bacterium]
MRKLFSLGIGLLLFVPFAKAQVKADFSAQPLNTCNGFVQFADSSTGGVVQWTWDFGDGSPLSNDQNPAHNYAANGSYSVSLVVFGIGGEDTLTRSNYITVNRPAPPMTTNDTAMCGGNTGVMLTATGHNGGKLVWFDQLYGGNNLGTGDTLKTSISKTTSFFVEEVEMQAPQHVGAPADTIGSGGNHTELNFGLLFDAYSAFMLRSVTVYANGDGDRIIQLRDGPGGTVLASRNVSLVDGENRVQLDIMVKPGTDYFLQVGGVPNLFRNSSGANYPYTLNNVLSITRSNAGGASNYNYYYYFYDWEVEAIGCISERGEAIAYLAGPPAPDTFDDTVCAGGGMVHLKAKANNGGDLNWYDAPTGGNLVDTGMTHTENITSDVTYYVSELIRSAAVKVGPVDNTFGNGSNYNTNSNLGLIFDVMAPMTIRSVKVYANGTGNRTINVYDGPGGTLLKSKTVMVQNGQSRIQLDFKLDPGTDYYITTLSPQNLFRNSSNPSYPYEIQDLVSIKGSNASQPMDYYYFFYDWEVEPAACESERVPVHGIVRKGNPLTLASNFVSPKCYGGNDGSIDLTVSGGSAPYAFIWSNGQTTEDASGLTGGKYTVTVTDANGCFDTLSTVVTQPAEIKISAIVIDATCSNNDGLIDVSVSGGTPAYTYLWSNGATTQDAGSLGAGSYFLTVTDSRGCTNVYQGVVTNQNGPKLASQVTKPSCFGNNDGSIDLMVTGGTPGYTYTWNTGATTQDISGLASGSYTVTVTDSANCVGLALIKVEDPQPLDLKIDAMEASCSGSSDGQLMVSVIGGTPGYSYEWSNGDTTATTDGLTPGSYTVTVTDANGCSESAVGVVNTPAPIHTTMSSTDESCQPAHDGTAKVVISGGIPPFMFQWDDAGSQTTPEATGLEAGMYHVEVTDSNGCKVVDSVEVAQPGVTLATSGTNTTCNGGMDGSIDLTVVGGAAPYSYEWSNGDSIQDPTGLPAGTYSVTVTDMNGCSATASETISEPTALVISSSVSNPTCGNNDGLIDISVTGGSPTYTYLWSNGNTTQDAGNIGAGAYTVTVTDSKGCSTVHKETLSNQGGPAPLTPSSTMVTCHGGNDGTATVSTSSGTPPYTFLWEDGQTAATATGLFAGDVHVTVTDNAGCVAFGTVTVNQPDSIQLAANITSASCAGENDGAIDLLVSGGIPGHSFMWNDSTTTEDRSGLTAGVYTVTVTDALGCFTVDSFEVGEPTAIALNINKQDASCTATSDGAASVTPTGGVEPYSYHWSTNSTDSLVTGLAAGTYSVTVTDGNGCTSTANVTIQSPNIILATNVSPVSCNGGTDGYIDLTVAGGVGPYTYDWSNGDTTEDIYNLPAGTYTITLTDANGCEKTTSETIIEPTLLQISAVVTEPSCGNNDGLINITVTGGSPSYTHKWSTGATSQDAGNIGVGNYTVTVTDANGCTLTHNEDVSNSSGPGNLTVTSKSATCHGDSDGMLSVSAAGGVPPLTYMWNTGATTDTITGAAGDYMVVVTDSNGCQSIASAKIMQPDLLVPTLDVTQITCNGAGDGKIVVTTNGGTSPYTYLWNNGATTKDLNGLSVGMYAVTVTDANGCMSADSAAVIAPVAISLTTTVHHASCNGNSDGSITVNVNGGTAPYTYLWDDASNQTTATATGLGAGTYHVTVTDQGGCFKVTQAVVNQPNITVALSSVPAACHGSSDGSVDLIVVGGTAPYAFNWSNGTTTEDLNGVPAGTYYVTVTDANGCSETGSETVTEPTAITITGNVSNSSCGSSNGLIDVSVSGGSPGYTYLWSNGATSQDVGSLSAGLYTVTVTDASGCTETLTKGVSDQGGPFLATAPIDVTCPGSADGGIDLTVGGGAAPYSFMWSNGATTEDLTGLTAGSYGVTVTDNNGCKSTENVQVKSPKPVKLNMSAVNESCYNCADGSATVGASGGTQPYTYQWNDANSQTTATATGLVSGTYYVTVTDANGCTGMDSVMVDFTVGVHTLVVDHTVNLYPNPTRDVVYMSGEGLKDMLSVQIFDMAGRMIDAPVSEDHVMSLANYQSGIYLVKVNFGDQSYKTFRIYKH